MIIISKKRIITLASMLCVTLIMCSLVVNTTENEIKTNTTIETVALPVTNKVIVVDARTWYSR